MSRCVKDKKVFNNDYYYTSELPNIIEEAKDDYNTANINNVISINMES